jgi:hypothetical protein
VAGFDRHDAYEYPPRSMSILTEIPRWLRILRLSDDEYDLATIVGRSRYHAIPRPPIDVEPWDDWSRRIGPVLRCHSGGDGSAAREAAVTMPPLPAGAIDAASLQLRTDGYCVLDARLAEAGVAALASRLLNADHRTISGDAAVFGLMNHEPAAWAVAATQPQLVEIARRAVGPRVRALDVALVRARAAGAGAAAAGLSAHRSARQFEVSLKRLLIESPWLQFTIECQRFWAPPRLNK